MISRSSYPGTQAVVRALSLLKAFGDAQPARRLSDLARATGLHKATARRLLLALEREGMVSRDAAGGRYRLGPEAIALGARAARAGDLRGMSRPALEALAAATGETATLEVLAAPDVLILDEVPGGSLVGATADVGTRWPAHTTSTGKAILALLPPEERRAALPARLPRRTERTITAPAAFDRELARVRGRGYATAIEELEHGYVAVGAAIRDRDGRAVAALSVGGPSRRVSPKRVRALGPEVAAAAARVSAALGYRAPEAE